MRIDHNGICLDDEVDQAPTKSHGGRINPHFIVMHYTAGWDARTAVDIFQNPSYSVSAHFVIGRDGAITQCVPVNQAAWHAGPSVYHGVRNLNEHSIGIEFVNIGYLTPVDGTAVIDPYGTRRALVDLPKEHASSHYEIDTIRAAHPRLGGGERLWPTYTQPQLASGLALVKALTNCYKIEEIVSHEEIDTRGWKTDPGPAFPMQLFRDALEHGEEYPFPRYQVNAHPRLNVRGGPGTGFEVLAKLNNGDPVQVMSRQGAWCLVVPVVDVAKGWVHSAYLLPF